LHGTTSKAIHRSCTLSLTCSSMQYAKTRMGAGMSN
jgi:hypothetical protein